MMMTIALVDRIRWHFASRAARSDALKNIGLVAGLIAVLGIAGTLDYQDALLAEAEAAAASANADANMQRAALLACLNNGAPGYYTVTQDGHRIYLVCQIHEVSDENVGRKRS